MKGILKNNQNENFCFPENNNSGFSLEELWVTGFQPWKYLFSPLCLLHPQVQPALASSPSEAVRRYLMVTLFGKRMFLRDFLFGWWWWWVLLLLLFCFCQFVLVWDIEISIIAKQAHLSSFLLKEEKIQPNWVGNVFLAEPWAALVWLWLWVGQWPGSGLGLAASLLHQPTLWGLFWLCRGTSIAQITGFEVFFMTGCTAWLVEGFWWFSLRAQQVGLEFPASSAHELLQLPQCRGWGCDVVGSLAKPLGGVSGIGVCSFSRAQTDFPGLFLSHQILLFPSQQRAHPCIATS